MMAVADYCNALRAQLINDQLGTGFRATGSLRQCPVGNSDERIGRSTGAAVGQVP